MHKTYNNRKDLRLNAKNNEGVGNFNDGLEKFPSVKRLKLAYKLSKFAQELSNSGY